MVDSREGSRLPEWVIIPQRFKSNPKVAPKAHMTGEVCGKPYKVPASLCSPDFTQRAPRTRCQWMWDAGAFLRCLLLHCSERVIRGRSVSSHSETGVSTLGSTHTDFQQNAFWCCTIRSLASSLSAGLAHPFVREQRERTLQDVCLTLCFIGLVLLNACSHLQQTPVSGWDVGAFWFNPICLERQIFFWGFDRRRNWGWSPDLDFLLNVTGRCTGNRQLSAFYYPQLPDISSTH